MVPRPPPFIENHGPPQVSTDSIENPNQISAVALAGPPPHALVCQIRIS